MFRNLTIWPKNFPASILLGDSLTGAPACIQAQATQELAGLAFLRYGQTRCDLAKPLDVNREDLIDQCSPFCRQLPEDNPLVFVACSSTHQTAVLELFHEVRRAGPVTRIRSRISPRGSTPL